LEKRGQIRLENNPGPVSDRDNFPGAALKITEGEHAAAMRKIVYLDACHEVMDSENYGKSSRKLIKRVLAEVAAKRGEPTPSADSFYRWKKADIENRFGDRVLALSPKTRVGNARQHFGLRVEQMIRDACIDAYSDPKGMWYSVRARAKKLCSQDGEYPDLGYLFDGERCVGISDRTFQRRFATCLDHYTRDFLRFGAEYAERQHATYLRINRPDAPLDIVDVDHQEMDVVVIDDEYPILFGRPDIVVFRDRHSGVVVNFEVSFGAPSYDTFLAGLRNVMFGKNEEDLPVGVKWPWRGKMNRLGVDNAMHFIGKDIQNAAKELGFQTVEYRPKHPWEKGALEHLLDITGNALVHHLPGSTGNSVEEREKYDEEKQKAVPTLTLRELKGFLTYYFAEVYNRSPHAGLGDFALAKGIPDEIWEKGMCGVQRRTLIDEEIFVRLAGNSNKLTIQDYGVQWDNLLYQSHRLQSIKLHPKHKKGTRYLVIRDPYDLGKVWVHDPYNKRVIDVPVSDRDAKYAVGLTRHQHEFLSKYFREKSNEKVNSEALLRVKNKLQNELMDFHKVRLKAGIAKKMARFVNRQKLKVEWSKTIDVEPVKPGSGRLDYLNPPQPEPVRKRSKRAGAEMPAAWQAPETEADIFEQDQEQQPEPADPPKPDTPRENPSTDDISAIQARNSDWED